MALFADALPATDSIQGNLSPAVKSREESDGIKQRGHGLLPVDESLEPLMLAPNLTISENSAEIFSLQFSPDERFLAAACGDGAIRVFHGQSGVLAHNLNPGTTASLPVTALQFRPVTPETRTRNVLVSCNASGLLQHWHVSSGKCLHQVQLPENNSVLCMDFMADASRFAVGCKDATVRVYDEATKKEVLALEGLPGFGAGSAPGHSNRVFSVKWHPEHRDCLLSGGWDNTVQIWDVREGRSVRSIYGPHIAGDALDVSGNVVLTGSYRVEKSLQLWDFASGDLIETISWENGPGSSSQCKIYAAKFSRGTEPRLFAAAGSDANEARVFDFRRGNEIVGTISGLERGVFALDFSPSGEQVAFAGGDCSIRIVDVVPADTGYRREVGTF